MTDATFIARAIEISRRALDQPGLRPFGAVVVKDGVIVGEGINAADGKNDPTSHGEVEAIRDACARLGAIDLQGCALYTSCEPCAMCTAAIHLVGIERLVFAATLEDSARAFAAAGRTPSRLSGTALRAEVGKPVDQRAMPAHQLHATAAAAVIQAFAAKPG